MTPDPEEITPTDTLYAARYREALGEQRCMLCRRGKVIKASPPWFFCRKHNAAVTGHSVCNDYEYKGAK